MVAYELETNPFPLDAKVYLADRQTKTFRRFLAKENGASKITFVDSWTDSDGVVYVKQTTTPNMSTWVPASVASYVAYYTSTIEYLDTLEYNPANLQQSPYCIGVTTKPAFTDYVRNKGTLRIVDVGDGQTKQVYEGNVTCNITGIGSYVEGYLKDSLVKIYSKYSVLLKKWADHREELLRVGSGSHELLADEEPFTDIVAPTLTWTDGACKVEVERTGAVLPAPTAAQVQQPAPEGPPPTTWPSLSSFSAISALRW